MMQLIKTLLESDLINSERLRHAVPEPVKRVLKRSVPYADFRSAQLKREAEKRLGGSIPTEANYDSPYDVTLGIFFDNGYSYTFNVAACRELKVRFKVVDITASDWIRRVKESECDAFLATPTTLRSVWHRMYDERLWVVANDLGKRLCPTYEELFLWESKRRMRDWLVAQDVPHPETWVFFDRDEALHFCYETRYPVVAKMNRGAAASGIFVLADRKRARRLVKQAFARGILGRSSDPREREEGTILFQEHVPHDYEWRVVRIGDDFMCRRKVRASDHASGSGDINFAAPLPGMLDFTHEVTERGGFRHITVDMFVDPASPVGEPRYLVNEMQAIIGFREVPESEHMGRWRRSDRGKWEFEAGRFHQNSLGNLRVKMLVDGT